MHQSRHTSVAREFLKLFCPVSGVLILLAAAVLLTQLTRFREGVELQERGRVDVDRQILESSISACLSDAVLLADVVANHVSSGSPARVQMQQMNDALMALAQAKRVYDQVRYLDSRGMEVVRVNRTQMGSSLVPEDRLQNKSGRPYFTKGLRTAGEVYVSQFDLNVERGAVEEPLKPMVRLAAPVVGPGGRTLGVVVLNYLGEHLLEPLRDAAQAEGSRTYLLNPAGYWLLGPAPEREWGFMFPGGEPNTLAESSPEAWRRMGSSQEGQFMLNGDLHTFSTASPLGSTASRRLHRGEAEEAWKVLSVVPARALGPQWRTAVVSLSAVLLLVLAIVSWQWARARARRREAVLALEDTERRLHSLSDAAQDAIVMANSAGNVVFWNPAAERVFGYAGEEALGMDLHDLVAGPEARHQAEKGLLEFSGTGRGPLVGAVHEVEALRKDGSSFTAELSLSSTQIDGEWHGVGTVHDITERVTAQAELLKYREQLEEQVEARTLALQQANEDLARARDISEAASRAKSVFLANVSHEIRTPLNAIVGFAGILDSLVTAPQQREYLASIRSSSGTLLQLIDNILDLSRLEAGDLDLAPAPVDLLKAFGDLEDAYRPGASDKGLGFEVNLDAGMPRSLCLDEQRFQQVLGSLADNAIKFTDTGSVNVDARCTPTEGDSDRVDLNLDVRDTGVGIPEDQRERIFEAFSQRHGQSINEYGGTGLGLSLTHRLLGLMDGRIWLDSQEGVGTTVHVVLDGVGVADATTLGEMQAETEPGRVTDSPAEASQLSMDGLDRAARTRLPAVIDELESRRATCSELAQTLTINDVEGFASELRALADENGIAPLAEWSGRLGQQASTFDMDGMADTLKGYGDLMAALRREADV